MNHVTDVMFRNSCASSAMRVVGMMDPESGDGCGVQLGKLLATGCCKGR